MKSAWTKFLNEQLQARLLEIATERGAAFQVDEEGRCWYDHSEWCTKSDPDIDALDEVFGPEWVAVYSDDGSLGQEQKRYFTEKGIRYVEWHTHLDICLVVLRQHCPPQWEYA